MKGARGTGRPAGAGAPLAAVAGAGALLAAVTGAAIAPIATAEWFPTEPLEGSALLVVVRLPPDAPEGTVAEAELDGRPVPLAPAPDGAWFGLGPLPVGASGDRALRVRGRAPEGDTEETAFTLRVMEREYASRPLRVEPRYAEPPRAVLRRIEEERERIRSTIGLATAEWRGGPRFGWPRPPRVSAPFGERRLYNERLQSRHYGLDLRGAEGAPVLAAAGGRVALTGDFYYQGKAVYVDHGLGVYTGYFHLSRIDVEEDQEVEAGQLLGGVGATGRVTGPHLHWSAYVAGQSVDPVSLLDLRLPVPEAP